MHLLLNKNQFTIRFRSRFCHSAVSDIILGIKGRVVISFAVCSYILRKTRNMLLTEFVSFFAIYNTLNIAHFKHFTKSKHSRHRSFSLPLEHGLVTIFNERT